MNCDGVWDWAEQTKTVYANYTDMFYHRSMEKDKLFVLDVYGAYGQKDIEILDRSGMNNKPARDNGGRLADRM